MNDMTKRRIVLNLPEMEQVSVERDSAYAERDGALLGFDVYRPPGTPSGPLPALLFVTGYADEGFKALTGCRMKEMGAYVSWGELVASAGIVGITYENRDPAEDAQAVLRYIVRHAAELGIDPARIGIWSSSGNVPNAIGLLCGGGGSLACAALCYGYMLDLDGDTFVRDAASQYRFVLAPASASIEAMPPLPLLVVRAGQDENPGLNASIDRFVAAALQRNLDLTLLDYPEAAHAFDIVDDSDASRAMIRKILAWIEEKLRAPAN